MCSNFMRDYRSNNPKFIFYKSLPCCYRLLVKIVCLYRTLFGLGIFLSEEDDSKKYTPLSELYCGTDEFLDVSEKVYIRHEA